MMWVCGRGEESFSGSSLRPRMYVDSGAALHESNSTISAPTLKRYRSVKFFGDGEEYAPNSESSKIRWSLFSMETWKPGSLE